VIVKAIIEHYKNIDFNKVTKIQYKDNRASQEKDCIFFIYLLDIQGFTKSLTFIPIVYDCTTRSIDENYSANLFEIIKKSTDYEIVTHFDRSSIDFYEQLSLEHMIEHQNRIEHEMSETNESLINDRISSLKQTFERQLKWLDDIIDKLKTSPTNNERIITMREAQKINLIQNYETKKQRMELDKKVIVSFEFIGGGVLHVDIG
jgi:hypothetical protein